MIMPSETRLFSILNSMTQTRELTRQAHTNLSLVCILPRGSSSNDIMTSAQYPTGVLNMSQYQNALPSSQVHHLGP